MAPSPSRRTRSQMPNSFLMFGRNKRIAFPALARSLIQIVDLALRPDVAPRVGSSRMSRSQSAWNHFGKRHFLLVAARKTRNRRVDARRLEPHLGAKATATCRSLPTSRKPRRICCDLASVVLIRIGRIEDDACCLRVFGTRPMGRARPRGEERWSGLPWEFYSARIHLVGTEDEASDFRTARTDETPRPTTSPGEPRN